jgi:hypothetical protein
MPSEAPRLRNEPGRLCISLTTMAKVGGFHLGCLRRSGEDSAACCDQVHVRHPSVLWGLVLELALYVWLTGCFLPDRSRLLLATVWGVIRGAT